MKPTQGRVFRRYLLTYLSVALVICLTLGVVLTTTASMQLRQSERELYESRMQLTADYIERQLEAMEEIRVEVKANLHYQPFYLRQSIVNSLGLIDVFSRFTSYSSWVDEYYLWYMDDEKVFSPQASYAQNVFFQYRMDGADQEALKRFLEPAGSVQMMVLPQRSDALLVGFPFYFGARRKMEEKAALLFLVRLSDIRSKVCDMTGAQKNAAFSLCYDGQLILGEDAGEDSLSATGPTGKVTLKMHLEDFPQYARLSSFSELMLFITLAVLVVGMGIAVLAAWSSYQPIRRLYTKYYRESAVASSNELHSIEHLLDSTLEINSLSQKQLEQQFEHLAEQQAWLKQQLVMMLISGNTSPVVQRQIAQTGFEMTHGLFAIMFLHIKEGRPSDRFMLDMEAFSGDEYSIYAAELHAEKEYAVMVNFEYEEQLEGLLELLADMLTAYNVRAAVQLSRSCMALSDVVTVALEALNAKPQALPEEMDKTAETDEDMILQVIELAEDGQIQQALTLLDTLIGNIEKSYPSYLMKICMLNMNCSRLIHRASQMGAALPQQHEAVSMQDTQSLIQYMRELVRCLAAIGVSSAEDTAPSAKVVNYIQEHYLDAEISLSSTAMALGVSTKQVTRLLRSSIDVSFKEYLLKLRMEEAKKLLIDNKLSIAETAERVCYFNASHFIKCFKAYTGLTPGEWKKTVN